MSENGGVGDKTIDDSSELEPEPKGRQVDHLDGGAFVNAFACKQYSLMFFLN